MTVSVAERVPAWGEPPKISLTVALIVLVSVVVGQGDAPSTFTIVKVLVKPPPLVAVVEVPAPSLAPPAGERRVAPWVQVKGGLVPREVAVAVKTAVWVWLTASVVG